MAKNTHLVYSTDGGRVLAAQSKSVPPATDGVVRIGRESKGRGGSSVCIISGLGLDAVALKALAKDLKRLSGAGGCVKNWNIEIQGDQREKLKAELEKRGFKVKLAGG